MKYIWILQRCGCVSNFATACQKEMINCCLKIGRRGLGFFQNFKILLFFNGSGISFTNVFEVKKRDFFWIILNFSFTISSIPNFKLPIVSLDYNLISS